MADPGRLPHALLFCGPAGTGKAKFCDAFTARLLCEQPEADFACGDCAGCRWLAAGNHPDYRLVTPESELEPQEHDADVLAESLGGKDRKPSTQIRVEQIRALEDFVSLGTHRQGRRVIVIRPAEAMNVATANGLLKLLEEPTASTYIVLVTSSPAHLLATIRSRCRRIDFSKPSRRDSLDWLAAEGVPDPESVLALCGGMPLAAAEFAGGNRRQLWERFVADMSDMLKSDPINAAARWETWLRPAPESERGLTLGDLVIWIQKWVFDLALLKMTGRSIYHPGMQIGLQSAAKAAAISDLFACYNDLLRAKAVAQHPLNTRLFLEDLALRYVRTICH
jgi:DNA polymerase-3 subunit delta'